MMMKLLMLLCMMVMVTHAVQKKRIERQKLKAKVTIGENERCKGSFRHAHILDTLSTPRGVGYVGQCMRMQVCKKESDDINKISVRGNCEHGLTCCYKSGGEVKFKGEGSGGRYQPTKVSTSRSTQKIRELNRAPAVGRMRKKPNHDIDSFDLESQLIGIDGLEKVKYELRSLKASYLLDAERRALGITVKEPPAPHMVFVGNPGTGKTTIAKMLGKLLYSIGVIETDKVLMVTRADLVGAHIGSTEKLTREKIQEAQGGVFFIDEAYQLYKEDSSKDFGHEAIEVIMNVLHDNDPVVIFAGYPNEMKKFMNANPGLRRRVGRTFLFEDYEFDQIAKIFVKNHLGDEYSIAKVPTTDQNKYNPLEMFEDDEAIAWLQEQMATHISDKQRKMFNVGLCDNLLDRARQIQNKRLMGAFYGDEVDDLDHTKKTAMPNEVDKKALLLQFQQSDLTKALIAIKAAFDASMEEDGDVDPGVAKDITHGSGAPTITSNNHAGQGADYEMISNLADALKRILSGIGEASGSGEKDMR